MTGNTLVLPGWFTIIAAIVGLVGGVIGTINGWRVIKRTSPLENMKKEMETKWLNFYEDKWDPMKETVEKVKTAVGEVSGSMILHHFDEMDKYLKRTEIRIRNMAEAMADQNEFLPLLLKSNHDVLMHLAESNHGDEMKARAKEIQNALFEKATKQKLIQAADLLPDDSGQGGKTTK